MGPHAFAFAAAAPLVVILDARKVACTLRFWVPLSSSVLVIRFKACRTNCSERTQQADTTSFRPTRHVVLVPVPMPASWSTARVSRKSPAILVPQYLYRTVQPCCRRGRNAPGRWQLVRNSPARRLKPSGGGGLVGPPLQRHIDPWRGPPGDELRAAILDKVQHCCNSNLSVTFASAC